MDVWAEQWSDTFQALNPATIPASSVSQDPTIYSYPSGNIVAIDRLNWIAFTPTVTLNGFGTRIGGVQSASNMHSISSQSALNNIQGNPSTWHLAAAGDSLNLGVQLAQL